MKKLFALIILLNMVSMPVFGEIRDDFAEKSLDKNLKIKPPKKVIVINESTMTPVKVRIKKEFTSQGNVYQEGDTIEFELTEDVKIKNKQYPKGTTVKSRLETVSQNGAWGVPSDVVIGNFSIDGIPLGGEINKTGANRAFWVYPCAYVFNILPGLGYAFAPIRGGHAKVKPAQTYTLYAE